MKNLLVWWHISDMQKQDHCYCDNSNIIFMLIKSFQVSNRDNFFLKVFYVQDFRLRARM